MLAIARALMSAPRVLLFDEPSMGLSPKLTAEVFQLIDSLRSSDVGILLVEQNASAALQLADSAAVIELGRIVLEGTGESSLLQNTKVQRPTLESEVKNTTPAAPNPELGRTVRAAGLDTNVHDLGKGPPVVLDSWLGAWERLCELARLTIAGAGWPGAWSRS